MLIKMMERQMCVELIKTFVINLLLFDFQKLYSDSGLIPKCDLNQCETIESIVKLRCIYNVHVRTCLYEIKPSFQCH